MAGEIPAAFGEEHLVINREKAVALISSGEMKRLVWGQSRTPRKIGAGMPRTIRPARPVCRKTSRLPLDANPRAMAFFAALDRANRYAILWRIQTVKKAETRVRKIAQFVAMLERHEKIHP